MNDTFDIMRFPFSYYGSWNSIRIPKGEEELFFCNHHSTGGNLFPLLLLKDGEVVAPEISVTPSLLTLTHGDAKVEICFENTKTFRVRGEGIGFRLGRKDLMYYCGENLFAINKPWDARYQVEIIKGSGELRQLVPTQPVYPKVLEIVPDADGRWELAIDKFCSTWVRPERPGFDECLSATAKNFEDFLAAMPAVRPQDEDARRLATYVNWATTVEPCGLVKRPSLLMSKFWMSSIWSWDHAFNAMALAAGHPGLSLDQMLTMVDHQDEFGCFPDSVKDQAITYNFSKPPVHGWAFSEMLEGMPETPSDEVMRTMYDSLSAQADWWMEHRVLGPGCGVSGEENGYRDLPYYLHGNDSGWDNSTMFSHGVPLVAPDLSALLVIQMDVLAELAEALGQADEAAGWKTRADGLYELFMKELWLGDHFVARLGLDGTVIESQSLIPWLPIILGKRLPEDVRGYLKKGIEGHLTDWGLATEKVDSPKYVADGYWKGPIWAPSTFIAVTGLDRCGFTDLADDVSEKFCKMCEKSGFPENFDAVTGEPLRCPAYTWTASVFLLLAQRMERPARRASRTMR
jgi:glycogen debranching enzyme